LKDHSTGYGFGVIAKALSYVTHGDLLLVFRQRERLEQGIQVPGGSVEAGEEPSAAALREAREETGLEGLTLRAYLGCAEYRLKIDVGPPHLRHFFHLSYDGPLVPRWTHPGSRLSDGRVVMFELWWEPLQSARLDWEMGAFLEQLRH